MNTTILFSLMAEAAAATGTGEVPAEPSMFGSIISLVLPLAAFVLIFWLFILRPEKKRNQETRDMLNSLQVADEVVTTGGIIGRVLSVQADTVLIETGSDRTKIRVVKTAIARNNTEHEAPAAADAQKAKKGKKEIK